MTTPVVYVKTEKGRTEVVTRQHELTPKFRAILILVDGVRSMKDFESRAGGTLDVRHTLEQLEAEGFICRAGAERPAIVTAQPSRPAGGGGLEAARATAVKLLEEAMGRDAGGFAPRLQRCATSEELLDHAQRYAIVISTVRDKSLGASYLQKVRDALAA